MAFVKDYLRTPPSFLTGMARVLDLGNTLDEYEVDPFAPGAADVAALASDWDTINEDLAQGYGRAKREAQGRGAGQ